MSDGASSRMLLARRVLAARRGWRALLGLLWLAVSYLALTPDPPPQIDTGWDKANHILAFASLAGAAMLAFSPARSKPAVIAALLVVYGILIEVLQSFVPGRTADAADVVADAVGIALGLLAAWWLLHAIAAPGKQLEPDPN